MTPQLNTDRPGDGEVAAIAADGFVFGYPLVLMDLTCAAFLRGPLRQGRPRRVNELVHARQLPGPSSTTVVCPNTDTLYSTGWLDLSAGALLLQTPPTGGRYWMMSLHSAWTDVIASLGPRTTGHAASIFAIVGPDFDGPLPPGVSELRSPTALTWAIGRTLVHGDDDLPAAHRFQDKLALSAFLPQGGPEASLPVPSTSPSSSVPPPAQLSAMDATDFFGLLANLLTANPPVEADRSMMNRLARIGLEPGQFRPNLSACNAIEAGMQAGISWFRHQTDQRQPAWGGWRTVPGLGAFGTNYRLRARVAHAGLGANLPEDALYFRAVLDDHDEPLDGEHRYVVHVEDGERPPVHAFWSLGLYDARGYLVDNPIGRHGISDRDPLVINRDGSLDLWLSYESPDPNKVANWLPAPDDRFELVLRLYWPTVEALDGTWTPPSIRKVVD